MNIGIIGAGVVGASLGKGWAAKGHAVMFSSRDPHSDKMQDLVRAAGPNARAGTVAETVQFGEVLLIAIGWNGLPDALGSGEGWSGKILIDATNRFGPPPPDSAGSAAGDLARMTGGRVVKAFNTIGADNMVDPPFAEPPTMFIAGDDAGAKSVVTALTEALGFEVVDAGPLANAGMLEELARLWVTLARMYGRNIAFRLLRR
ncbi:MAG: NAD(P)-binding domain-containing protein [Anaerolineae bacterium]|nr:NAD(P)-binding domain-containing protein [Anaerolineae bacterium]